MIVRKLFGLCLILVAMFPTPISAQEAGVLRTSDGRFAGLPDYRFAPHYADVRWGERSVRMHYVDEGPRDGAVVLMLHGQPSWSFMYRKLITGLSAKGYRVIAPDLIGYGRSDKPAQMVDYSYARHMASVEMLIERLALKDVTLVVHDWGGLIGLPIAARRPELFAKLAIFNTSLNDGTDIESPQYKAGFDRWIQLLRTVPLVEADKVIAAQVAVHPAPNVLAAYMAPYPDGSYQAGVRQMSGLIPRGPEAPQAKQNGDAREALRAWRKPVMIAFSEDSDRIHPGQFSLFTELFPKEGIWDVRRIEGTRHFLFEDRPDEILTLLSAFLNGDTPPTKTLAKPKPTGYHPALSGETLQADVATFVSFGDQHTGSPASRKSLEWMDMRLRQAGFRTRREPLPVNYHAVESAQIAWATTKITDGIPIWPVSFTHSKGLTARLVSANDAGPGDIALLRLPFSPYASVFDPVYRPIFADVLARRPAAVIAVTEHPSGEVVALNVRDASESGNAPRRPMPVLLVGQKHMAALNEVTGEPITLTLSGRTKRTADANLIAESGPEVGPLIVVSTPRNGWFRAGGERGPGLAILLGLAHWLRDAHPEARIRLVVSSHHELGGLGMKAVLDKQDPAEKIALWLHLGANIATREAEKTTSGMHWLETANTQRGAAASPRVINVVREAFAGVPRFEVGMIDGERTVGEAALIARSGNFPIVGLVGYQLAHHTRLDDASATSPYILESTASAIARLIDVVIQQQKATNL